MCDLVALAFIAALAFFATRSLEEEPESCVGTYSDMRCVCMPAAVVEVSR